MIGEKPRPFYLRDLEGLHARAFGVLAGPGGGKTRTIAELHGVDGAMFTIDPVGELARQVDRLFPDDVQVWHVPPDYTSAELDWLADQLKGGRKVCAVVARPYTMAPGFADAAIAALVEAKVRELVLVVDEIQRVTPQSQAHFSYETLAAWEMGRNWSWGRFGTSQRPADVDKRVLERCDTLLLGRIQGARDAAAVDKLLELNVPDSDERDAIVRSLLHLEPGQFVLRSPAHPPKENTE